MEANPLTPLAPQALMTVVRDAEASSLWLAYQRRMKERLGQAKAKETLAGIGEDTRCDEAKVGLCILAVAITAAAAEKGVALQASEYAQVLQRRHSSGVPTRPRTLAEVLIACRKQPGRVQGGSVAALDDDGKLPPLSGLSRDERSIKAMDIIQRWTQEYVKRCDLLCQRAQGDRKNFQ